MYCMQDAGYSAHGPVMLYQYYPPFAPNFIRLCEVLLAVDE